MIPFVEDFQIEEIEESSKDYRLDLKENRIEGFVDELKAMEQVVYKILNTERYEHIIYSWDYGVELSDLIGRDMDYVKSEVKDRIKEALTQDDRIETVDEFSFTEKEGGILLVEFIVHTIYGNIKAEKEVNV